MSLKKLKFVRPVVTTPMGDIALRGLNLPMVRKLIADHPLETQALYATGMELAVQFETKPQSDVDIIQFLGTVIHNMPIFAAHVIALASGDGDEESITIASELPIDVQLECFEKIAAATFVMEGGARNFIVKVLKIVKQASAAMKT